jgi:hypothetical protein
MTLVALRTADLDGRHRVAEFKAAAAHICKLGRDPGARRARPARSTKDPDCHAA